MTLSNETYPVMMDDVPKKVEYVPEKKEEMKFPEQKQSEVKPPVFVDSRVSINSLDDIEYFPELRPGSIDAGRFDKK